MIDAIPTESLMRYLRATPEQRAAIDRFLAGEPLPATKGGPPPAEVTSQVALPEAPESDQKTLNIAAKVFELLTALDSDKRLRKAPPIKVFLLHFRQNLSRSAIAGLCDCDKSLVALRLKTIKERLPWQPRQLRELSAQVEAMQEAVSDSRARRIYRKGAVYGEEEESQGDE